MTWIKLFSLIHATAKQCDVILLENMILRYTLPRRISENESQIIRSNTITLFSVRHRAMSYFCMSSKRGPTLSKVKNIKPWHAILVGDGHGTRVGQLHVTQLSMNIDKLDYS